jgi:phospholipid/cholesterol/gamma-HCH transport system ATP-binding protein
MSDALFVPPDGRTSAPSRPIAVRVRGVTTRFGTHIIHDGIDLDVYRGEILGLVGGSGAGKSVLLRTIIGLMHPSAGSVEVLGQNMGALGPDQLLALQARWGVLFQDGALFSSLTVLENIDVPLKEHTRLAPAMREEIARIKLAMVGLGQDAAHKYPSQLSGGMRKRAGLARALALDPEILFLDEPTAGLDPIGAHRFDELIKGLQQALGLTVLIVTHDLDTLYAICDRVAALADKRLLIGDIATMEAMDHPWIRDYFHGPRGRAAAGKKG